MGCNPVIRIWHCQAAPVGANAKAGINRRGRRGGLQNLERPEVGLGLRQDRRGHTGMKLAEKKFRHDMAAQQRGEAAQGEDFNAAVPAAQQLSRAGIK